MSRMPANIHILLGNPQNNQASSIRHNLAYNPLKVTQQSLQFYAWASLIQITWNCGPGNMYCLSAGLNIRPMFVCDRRLGGEWAT